MTYSKYAQTDMKVDLRQHRQGLQEEYLQQIHNPGSSVQS